MVTPDGPACDHCQRLLCNGARYFDFFFCHFVYCSPECLNAAHAERLHRLRAQEYYLHKHGTRHWKVVDGNDDLVCITLYKKGAAEVIFRLSGRRPPPFRPETGAAVRTLKPKRPAEPIAPPFYQVRKRLEAA